MGGGRVKVARPRAHSIDAHELSLPSWRAWSARDPLNERAFDQMVLGVSTRRYARSLEPLPSALAVNPDYSRSVGSGYRCEVEPGGKALDHSMEPLYMAAPTPSTSRSTPLPAPSTTVTSTIQPALGSESAVWTGLITLSSTSNPYRLSTMEQISTLVESIA
jgi:hypothetical protein